MNKSNTFTKNETKDKRVVENFKSQYYCYGLDGNQITYGNLNEYTKPVIVWSQSRLTEGYRNIRVLLPPFDVLELSYGDVMDYSEIKLECSGNMNIADYVYSTKNRLMPKDDNSYSTFVELLEGLLKEYGIKRVTERSCSLPNSFHYHIFNPFYYFSKNVEQYIDFYSLNDCLIEIGRIRKYTETIIPYSKTFGKYNLKVSSAYYTLEKTDETYAGELLSTSSRFLEFLISMGIIS